MFCDLVGDRKIGIAELRQVLTTSMEENYKLGVPQFLGRLAELEAEEGEFEGSLERIDEALALSRELGHSVADAFLHQHRVAALEDDLRHAFSVS
jgi:hypothetical protein